MTHLVVGLRNPGRDYAGTRHNVGAEVVERLARRSAVNLGRAPARIRAETGSGRIGGRQVVLALPTTFMNESGAAVGPLARYYDVDPTRLVVVHDDIDLPFGRLRLQAGRGSGGNRGVESVAAAVGGVGFWRLRFGVGRPPGRQDPADFVLRRFTAAERPDVDVLVESAADVVVTLLAEGEEAARNLAGHVSRIDGQR